MARVIANNHTGITVRFLYPTPKERKEPSLLYKNPGLSFTIKNIQSYKNNNSK